MVMDHIPHVEIKEDLGLDLKDHGLQLLIKLVYTY